MDFANERYVRLYVRDTLTWKRLGWDGQNATMQLLRRADRSGVIDLAGVEPWESLVALCGAPEGQARSGVARMLELEVARRDGDRLVFPRYGQANACAQTGAQRMRTYRDRKRNDTDGDETSRIVTASDGALRGVTKRYADDALTGRVWLRDGTHLDYDHGGKWRHALEQLAQKPEREREVVAAAVRRVLEADPHKHRILTPQHILDYWARYAIGEFPGQQVKLAAAQPTELEQLSAQYKELARQERECLYDEEDRRAKLQERMQQIGVRMKALHAGGSNGRSA